MAAHYRATVAVRFGGFTELGQIVTCASGCSSVDPFFLFIYIALPSPVGSVGLGSVEFGKRPMSHRSYTPEISETK
jgi:hypothetical protein